MKANFKSGKGLALVLAVAMMLALVPAVALAAVTYNSMTLNVGETKSGIQEYNPGTTSVTGTVINSVVSNDPSVVTAPVSSGTTFSLYGVKAGQTTVTVNWTDSSSTTHQEIITVTVNNTYNSNSALSVAVAGSTNTRSYTQITNVSIANPAIASVVNNTTYATVTGISAGTTTLTVSYFNNGSITSDTYTITVTGSYNGSGTTTPAGQQHTLAVGQTNKVSNIVQATNIVSSNPSVGTAAIEDGVLVLKGLSAGTTDITFSGSSTVGGAASNYKITLTVTGSGTATATASTGVTFSKASTSVDSGKNYRLKGMKINGTSASASELRWMSTDTDVMTVNAKTGVFKGKTSGSAYLIAADPSTGAVGSIKVEIK